MLPCGQLTWLEGVVAPTTDHVPQTGGLHSRRFWRLGVGNPCAGRPGSWPADRAPSLSSPGGELWSPSYQDTRLLASEPHPHDLLNPDFQLQSDSCFARYCRIMSPEHSLTILPACGLAALLGLCAPPREPGSPRLPSGHSSARCSAFLQIFWA